MLNLINIRVWNYFSALYLFSPIFDTKLNQLKKPIIKRSFTRAMYYVLYIVWEINTSFINCWCHIPIMRFWFIKIVQKKTRIVQKNCFYIPFDIFYSHIFAHKKLQTIYFGDKSPSNQTNHLISPRKCLNAIPFWKKKMKNKNSVWFYSLKTFSKSCSESDGSSLSIDEPDGCFTPDESNGFPVKSYKYVFLNEFPEIQWFFEKKHRLLIVILFFLHQSMYVWICDTWRECWWVYTIIRSKYTKYEWNSCWLQQWIAFITDSITTPAAATISNWKSTVILQSLR